MSLPILVGKYFWIVFIILSYFQVAAPRSHVKDLKKNEQLLDEYYELIRRILIIINIPWIIMGLGILSGSVSTVWNYMQPPNGNFFVILFFASIVFVWSISLHWTFLQGGAEKVEKFQLFYKIYSNRKKRITAKTFKIHLVLAIIVGTLALVFLLTSGFHISQFK